MVKKCGNTGIRILDDPNVFIEYSNTMVGVYSNIDDCNPRRKRKMLIAFDNVISDITINQKFQATIKELFIRCRKLNKSLIFITKSYFRVSKDIRLNSSKYLIMKIHNRRELQQIALDHSADIDYKDLQKFYKRNLFFFEY